MRTSAKSEGFNVNAEKKVILLAVHGMGPTRLNFANRLHDELKERLGNDSANVHLSSIYYQNVFQVNQTALWDRVKQRRLDWRKTRKLLLYGFSDAAGYERNAAQKGSSYEQVQIKIRDKLKELYKTFDNLPIVIVAQSLGGHVISNYIWDAQKDDGASRGIWRANRSTTENKSLDKFLRLQSIRLFFTTGCNIPIFVANLPESMIKAVGTQTQDYTFKWKNYYDVDDALGWPLKPLSESYKKGGIFAVCEGLILLASRAGSDYFTPQKNERMRAGGRPNCQFLDFHPKMQ